MIIYLYCTLVLLNLIFAYRKKDSKLLSVITLIAVYLFFVGYRNEGIYASNDLSNYINSYNNVGAGGISSATLEVGYLALMKIGNLLNLDFYEFKACVIALCIFILISSVKRYSNKYNYILLLYMLYPMIIDTEHFRNFIALTVLIFSIRYLEENTMKYRLKYSIFILIASSFHYSFFIYLIFLFANTKNKNKLVKLIALTAIVVSLATYLNSNNIPFLSSILNNIDNDKLYSYAASRTNYGFLIPFALHTINFLMVLWARYIYIRSNPITDSTGKDSTLKYIQLILILNSLAFVFFPLYMMSITFYRLSRNLFILNFIVYSKTSDLMNRRSLIKFVFNLVVILTILIWLLLDLVYKTPAERVLIPFFTENHFFNWNF